MSAVRLHHVADAGPHVAADAPVVLLGGSLGSTVAMWQPQVEALAEHFRVVRYDTRGHGLSPAPPGPYALDDLADDVLALLDDLEVARAHCVGLSLGGMTLMALAARAPERVDRLALVCTSAHYADLDPWRARIARVRAGAPDGGTAAIADGVVARWFTPAFAADPAHADVISTARRWVADTDDEGYAACCEAIAGMDLAQALPAITAPTLVLAGRHDLATPPAMGQAIAAAVPGAVLQLLDAAHLANVEAPAAVTRALVEHLVLDPAATSGPASESAQASEGEE